MSNIYDTLTSIYLICIILILVCILYILNIYKIYIVRDMRAFLAGDKRIDWSNIQVISLSLLNATRF